MADNNKSGFDAYKEAASNANQAKSGLIDWDKAEADGVQFEDIARDPSKYLRNPNSTYNQGQIMHDHARWEISKDRIPDGSRYQMYSQGKDLGKSYQDQVAEEKRKKRNALWEQVGYALMNLGNFVGAAAWGSPSPEKTPDSLELTKRQQALKDKNEALRNAYNKDYFENYWKQRAEESNQTRLSNEKRKLDRMDEEMRLKNRRQDWLEKYQQGRLDHEAEKLRIDKEYKEHKISLDERNTAVRELNAFTSQSREARLAGGTTVETTGADGSKKTVVTTPNYSRRHANNQTETKTLGIGLGGNK